MLFAWQAQGFRALRFMIEAWDAESVAGCKFYVTERVGIRMLRLNFFEAGAILKKHLLKNH